MAWVSEYKKMGCLQIVKMRDSICTIENEGTQHEKLRLI